MNRILQTRIPPGAFVMLAFGLLISAFFYYAEGSYLKWLPIIGCAIYTTGKIGQYSGSGNERIYERFSVLNKAGILIISGTIILKGFLIIKQQNVYVVGFHVVGSGAVWHGILLIILGSVLYIYSRKKIT